jgi:transcriptional regulator with XRE-family HTH domain
VLEAEGYIRGYSTTDLGNGRTEFEIELERMSKPSRNFKLGKRPALGIKKQGRGLVGKVKGHVRESGEREIVNFNYASLENRSNKDQGALAQLGSLRDRLASADPTFSVAAQVERGAEAFCDKVRTELKAHRLALGLNQQELADRIEVSQSAISKIESGHGDLSLKTVFRIAEAMRLNPVMAFTSSAHAGIAARQPPAEAAAAALAGAVQEDLIRRIPEIVQEAAARVAASD